MRDVRVAITPEGVLYTRSTDAGGDWRVESSDAGTSAEVIAFAAQVEELGYASPGSDGELVLPWQAVYRVLEHDDFGATPRTLPIPPIDPAVVPALRSTGTISDANFGIAIAGWHRTGGGKVAERLELIGPVHAHGAGQAAFTLSEPVFALADAIRRFQQRDAQERSPQGNRLAWGEIRELALRAGAVLDNFLRDTIVLRPRMLGLNFERVHAGDDVAVRVAPTFAGAPEAWLEQFDKARLTNLYKIVDRGGLGYCEVIVEDAVLEVLTEIKRLPGRTVAGERARRLIENPFAFFEGSRGEVFDEAAIEAELQRLREDAWTFRPQVDLADDGTVAAAGIELEPIGTESVQRATIKLFATPDGLEAFIRRADDALAEGHAYFAWEGLELEVGGRGDEYLRLLDRVLSAWRQGQPVEVGGAGPEARDPEPEADGSTLFVIDALSVLDVSRYYERVDSIGIETRYGIITIPLSRKGAWLPEDEELQVLIRESGAGDDAVMSLDRDGLAVFARSIAAAEEQGAPEVPLPGGGSMPVEKARDFIDALPGDLKEDVAPAKEPASTERPAPRARTGLLIKPNIDAEDYVTQRSVQLRPPPGAVPLVPSSLRPDVALKNHQLDGLLWLQHLFTASPTHCRGALLADDMGLGKTLQTLALIARALEDDPDLDPALVVAPVTLLENWAQEAARFFEAGSLPIRTLYGPDLQSFRVKAADIDERLRSDGLKRFLTPGWQEGAAIVLTTYETLRDFEFSFGDVRWSIVVCDEAQRIKNPNALVSRAAKKLNARFCVAATGTPVENNLTDLWSLFDFIQPGLLDPLNRFNRKYRRPIEAKTAEELERLDELRRIVDPQIKRRTKEDVARDLPAKIFDEDCRILGMSNRQRELYASALGARKTAENVRQSGTELLQLISVLRRICTDPRAGHELEQPLPSLSTYRQMSPKLDWLLTTLEMIRTRGEKAIIFLDRKDIQRLVQAYIRDHFGFAPEIINGDTPTSGLSSESRQRRIDRFQASDGFSVLILSPVAAGVGLNIQEANHVIHYMRHWNPAKEDQATDRAYRIGQERDVTVYTPIVVGDGWVSFDQRLDELLEKKREIAANMLNGSDDIGAAEFADLVA